MVISDYFKDVREMSAEEVREYLGTHRAGQYNLVDVRTPKEYERGHIPGALLIPLNTLHARLDEIAPSRPTIVY